MQITLRAPKQLTPTVTKFGWQIASARQSELFSCTYLGHRWGCLSGVAHKSLVAWHREKFGKPMMMTKVNGALA
jgi:hypothetical protein